MQAVVIERPKSFKIEELQYPKPGEGEVTLDVRACCVCGTDIHLLDGEFKGSVYPLIPGHEFSGVVREVGLKVTHVKPGDRVAVEPFMACGYCFFCKTGKTNQCLNGMVIGHTASKQGLRLDGGFAENVVVPAKNLIPLANHVSFEAGSFIANLGTIVYAIRRAQLQAGMKVLVFGTGANGLILAQLSKKTGASTVVVTGRTKSRLEVALSMGIDATVLADDSQEKELKKIAPLGFDIVFEATGSPQIVERTFRFVKNGGKIVLYGIVPPEQNSVINAFDICRRDLEILGSFSSINTCIIAHELLSSGVIQVEHLISHRFSLQDWGNAIRTAREPSRCMRAIVLMP
ncbi:MAG: zinc-binding dehydrogenase [Deltaproteobacteria bacterium]|nr:zinc-binding dehydrogenase [Deltaproteobacteria bacterium]